MPKWMFQRKLQRLTSSMTSRSVVGFYDIEKFFKLFSINWWYCFFSCILHDFPNTLLCPWSKMNFLIAFTRCLFGYINYLILHKPKNKKQKLDKNPLAKIYWILRLSIKNTHLYSVSPNLRSHIFLITKNY